MNAARLGFDAVRALARAGVLAPVRPDRLARMAGAVARLGPTPAAGVAAAAARHPDVATVIDERGTLTFAELVRRTDALAGGLHSELGVGPERALAIMCRNHRGFLEAVLAASRLGADIVLLNTDFGGPQLGDVLDREDVGVAVHDAEFTDAFEASGFAGPRAVAWTDGPTAEPTLDDLAARGDRPPASPGGRSRMVILTSGTTGTPKGARRDVPALALLGPVTTMLDEMELRTREPILDAPPLFHALGLGPLGLAAFLGAPLVLRRRFDPEATLAAIQEHRVATLVVVPVMLRRLLALEPQTRRRYDVSSLRAVLCGGSALSPDLATEFMDAFGDVLFNLYGSTETGWGALATPADLRAAPGTVGRPPHGAVVRILDEAGGERPTGTTGRIFLGSGLVFDGYTGGGGKEVVDGLTSTGDLGHVDEAGRLFVEGRDDDMIVSGGENVFPQEVEEVLARHADVADVAVLGVSDDEFGQRLAAFVVARPGSEPSADELKAWVKANLARYKVPRDVVLVDELPRTPTGKVARRALLDVA